MSDDASLQTSFWLMILLQTMGSVDMPGSGDRKLPAPRAYLATIVIWSVLQVAADAGAGRAAKASAWVVVLAGLVFGPFGIKVANLFTKIAGIYAPPAAPATPGQAPGTTPNPAQAGTAAQRAIRTTISGIPYVGEALAP